MNNQGMNGQIYNTNQIEVVPSISNGVEQTIHSSSTSSLGQRNNIYQGNTIFAPQVRRGLFYLGSLLNYHEESVSSAYTNHLNTFELVPQINLHQQYHQINPTIAVQDGGNDGQQSHHDPELRRSLLETEIEIDMERVRIGELLRLQLRRRHRRFERELTEEEIMKYISCETFKDTVGGTSEDKELCCICQEAYVDGEEIGKLGCTHIFHVNCIKQWIAKKNICPLCRCRGL